MQTLDFAVPIFEPLPEQYFVRVLSDEWMGAGTVVPVPLRNLVLPIINKEFTGTVVAFFLGVCGRSDRCLFGAREEGRQNRHRPLHSQTAIYSLCTALPQQKRCACPPSPRACWEPTGSCGSSSHFQSLTPFKPRYVE